ncbi:MAG: YcxB family protein [Flavonifractor plautii]|nr:YcxB family protein [Flavonifractor plautii]
MEIICSTTYDRRALSALARALRKTVRRTRSRLLRVWCWVLLGVSLLSAWVSWGEWGTVALNGAVVPGMEVCTVRFLEEHYETKIAGAATQWQYSKLLRLAENDRYLVLILGKNHGQLCDKEELTGAAPEELRAFLEQKTGLTVERFR